MSDTRIGTYHMDIVPEDHGMLQKGDHILRFPTGECIIGLQAAVVELNRQHAEIGRLQAVVDKFMAAHEKFREACLAQRAGAPDKGERQFREGLHIVRDTAAAALDTRSDT